MPQAAWEALLSDAVQGLHSPYTPQTLGQWLQTTHPRASAIGAPQPPPPSPPPPHREGKGHKQGEGKGREGTTQQEGKEGPKVTGRRPQGQGTGSDTTQGQETTHGPGRGKNRDRGAGKEDTTAGTRAHTQKGHAATEVPVPPHPQRSPRDPRSRTPPTHTAEARIGRRTDHTGSRPPATRNHTGEGGQTYTARKGYTHRGTRREHRRATCHHALTARRRPRQQQGPTHRHRKRKRAQPQRPGLEARTARQHGTKAQPPREGNSADACQTHQPKRHTQTPTARSQRATPHLTAPPSHQPATLRPALRTTTRAGLTSTDPPRQNTRQHGTPHPSAPPCNAPPQGTQQHNTPQHKGTRRGTARHATARHGATRHDQAGHTTTQHGAAQRSTPRHGTKQHGAPQHTTTPKQGTLTEGLTQPSRHTPRKAPHQPATHRSEATAPPATTIAVRPHKPPPES